MQCFHKNFFISSSLKPIEMSIIIPDVNQGVKELTKGLSQYVVARLKSKCLFVNSQNIVNSDLDFLLDYLFVFILSTTYSTGYKKYDFCPHIFCILKERQGSFKETILKLKLRMYIMGTNAGFRQCLLYPLVRSKQKDIIIKLQMGAETVTCH